jgi:hypothetical protein
MMLAVAVAIPTTTTADGPKAAEGAFVVEPYLQLGDAPTLRPGGGLDLLWQAEPVATDWGVEYRPGPGAAWRKAETPASRRIAVAGVAPYLAFRAELKGLARGGTFAYRVRRGGEVVFEAEGKARKGPDQPYRFVAFGDCAAGTPEQRQVAYRTFLEKPDFVMITGDIVYSRGQASEYRKMFWPVYNADEARPDLGAPLLRSTLFVAAPGNHDVATRDLGKYPDGLAYFYNWDQPTNGPAVDAEGGPLVPMLYGPVANKAAFLAAAGRSYPRMVNFSFDYGNAHWTVLDANPYVDWRHGGLRDWVARDLAAAKDATWRFVAFHHPGFNSSKTHFEQQKMRLLAEVFEAGKVDVAFCGHVHNYQRTFPLTFIPQGEPDDRGRVAGRWTLDRSFDGKANTRPNGILYLVTGAGGQHLYNPEQHDDPKSWQEFTYKFNSKVHSLTVADVVGKTLTVRQVAADGKEIDRFVVTKP